MTIKLRTRLEQEKLDLKRKKLEVTLKNLQKDQSSILSKISKVKTKIENMDKEDEQDYIESLPKRYSKFTKKQWEWVLEQHEESGTQIRYNYCKDLIWKLGFDNFGYIKETNQHSLTIPKNFNKEKIIKSFNIIKKHLKEVTLRNSKDKGVPFLLHLNDDTNLIVYYHKKDKTFTLRNRPDDFFDAQFKTFNELLNWYGDYDKYKF